MTFEPDGWQAVDPTRGAVASELPDAPFPGEIVVLASVGSEDDEAWSPGTAAVVVRQWALVLERMVVVDLDLTGGGIHEFLGAEGGEGATDLFLFGASLKRVAQPVDDGEFYFTPSGTPAADPEQVLDHPRWERVIGGVRDVGATLVAYLPLGQPGARALLKRADRVVALGRPDGEFEGLLSEVADRIQGTLIPPDVGDREDQAAEVDEAEVDVAEVQAADIEKVEDQTADVEEAEEVVVDIADLAPDGPAVLGRADLPVVDIADLAPDVAAAEVASTSPGAVRGSPPSAADAEIVEIGALAPDPVVSGSRRHPDEGGDGEGRSVAPIESEDSRAEAVAVAGAAVVDITDLAPDGWEARAPDENGGSGRADASDELDEPAELGDSDELDEPDELDALDDLAEREGSASDEGGLEDFDLGRLDALAEGSDRGGEMATEPDGRDDTGEISDDEPEEGPGSGDDADDRAAPEPGAEEAAGFGDFSGEVEQGDVEPEGPEDRDVEPSVVEPGVVVPDESEAGGREEPGGGDPFQDHAPSGEEEDEGFGEGLVTGPDFGEGAPDLGEGWDEESPADEDDRAAAAVAGREARSAEPAESDEVPSAAARRRESEDRKGAEEPEKEPGAPSVVGVDRGAGAQRDRRRRRPLRLAVILVLVAAGAVTAHWFDVVDVPFMDRVLISVLGPAGSGAAPVVETLGPEPDSPVQSESLLIDAYRDARTARDVAMALQQRLPDRLVLVAPVQVEGSVEYRLLAGPATDASEAEALREPVAAILTREDPSEWSVRTTPYAFLVDELDDLDAARARAASLSEGELFAYVLRVQYPGGDTRFRVYSGAYADGEEARALQGLLNQAGIDDATFTERRGGVPE